MSLTTHGSSSWSARPGTQTRGRFRLCCLHDGAGPGHGGATEWLKCSWGVFEGPKVGETGS